MDDSIVNDTCTSSPLLLFYLDSSKLTIAYEWVVLSRLSIDMVVMVSLPAAIHKLSWVSGALMVFKWYELYIKKQRKRRNEGALLHVAKS